MFGFLKKLFWDFPLGLIERARNSHTSVGLVILHILLWTLLMALVGGFTSFLFYKLAELITTLGVWTFTISFAILSALMMGPFVAGIASHVDIGPLK